MAKAASSSDLFDWVSLVPVGREGRPRRVLRRNALVYQTEDLAWTVCSTCYKKADKVEVHVEEEEGEGGEESGGEEGDSVHVGNGARSIQVASLRGALQTVPQDRFVLLPASASKQAPSERWVQCDECTLWAHMACTMYSGDAHQAAAAGHRSWHTCMRCQLRHSQERDLRDTGTTTPMRTRETGETGEKDGEREVGEAEMAAAQQDEGTMVRIPTAPVTGIDGEGQSGWEDAEESLANSRPSPSSSSSSGSSSHLSASPASCGVKPPPPHLQKNTANTAGHPRGRLPKTAENLPQCLLGAMIETQINRRIEEFAHQAAGGVAGRGTREGNGGGKGERGGKEGSGTTRDTTGDRWDEDSLPPPPPPPVYVVCRVVSLTDKSHRHKARKARKAHNARNGRGGHGSSGSGSGSGSAGGIANSSGDDDDSDERMPVAAASITALVRGAGRRSKDPWFTTATGAEGFTEISMEGGGDSCGDRCGEGGGTGHSKRQRRQGRSCKWCNATVGEDDRMLSADMSSWEFACRTCLDKQPQHKHGQEQEAGEDGDTGDDGGDGDLVYPYRSRCIVLFLKRDGLDVLVFGM